MAINSELEFHKHAPTPSVMLHKRIGGVLPILVSQSKQFHYCHICKGWVEGFPDVQIIDAPEAVAKNFKEHPLRKSWHCRRCTAEQLSFGIGDGGAS